MGESNMALEEYDLEDVVLQPHDWNDALSVQNASNLTGVVNSMNILGQKVRDESKQHPGLGTDWINHHPILRLFAYKVSALAGQEDVTFGVSDEYRELEALAASHAARKVRA